MFDCRGASIRSGVCRGSEFGWSSQSWLFVHCLAPPIAFDVEFEDGGVVYEPIDGGQGHGWVGEDFLPLAEGLIVGDEHGLSFIAGADQFEQNTGFRLVLGDLGEVIKDQEVEAFEPGDRGLKGEFSPCDL